jgi:hypothetical protein
VARRSAGVGIAELSVLRQSLTVLSPFPAVVCIEAYGFAEAAESVRSTVQSAWSSDSLSRCGGAVSALAMR